MSASISEQAAAWSCALRTADLPAGLLDWLGLRVADSTGLIAAARGMEPGRIVLHVGQRSPGATPVLFETCRVAPPMSAMVHGTLLHVLDYDDTYPDSVVHPSCVVVATALAVGADTEPGTLSCAMLAGYEFMARLGSAVGRRLHARGFHATAVLGPPVAALVAARTLGLDEARTVAAIGLAGSMSSGLLEFVTDGTWSKRMHPGWAAHGGVIAAQLAADGFHGPREIFEGRHGIFRAFLDDDGAVAHEHMADLGATWRCRALQTKLYPCAHVIHPYLDLLLLLRERHGVRADDVESIGCYVAEWSVPIVLDPIEQRRRPVNEYHARASLPFACAVALVDGTVTPEAFSDESVTRPDLLAVTSRFDYHVDAAAGGGFGGRLELRLRDGTVLAAGIDDLPPTDGVLGVRRKFEANILALPGSPKAGVVWAAATQFASTGVPGLVAACSA